MLNIDTLPDFRQELFAPTAAQTVFVLSTTPNDPQSVGFYVNGAKYKLITHFTIVAATITWNNAAFVMAVTDDIEVIYTV